MWVCSCKSFQSQPQKKCGQEKSLRLHSLRSAMTFVALGIHHVHFSKGGKSSSLGGKSRHAMKLCSRSRTPLNLSFCKLKDVHKDKRKKCVIFKVLLFCFIKKRAVTGYWVIHWALLNSISTSIEDIFFSFPINQHKLSFIPFNSSSTIYWRSIKNVHVLLLNVTLTSQFEYFY